MQIFLNTTGVSTAKKWRDRSQSRTHGNAIATHPGQLLGKDDNHNRVTVYIHNHTENEWQPLRGCVHARVSFSANLLSFILWTGSPIIIKYSLPGMAGLEWSERPAWWGSEDAQNFDLSCQVTNQISSLFNHKIASTWPGQPHGMESLPIGACCTTKMSHSVSPHSLDSMLLFTLRSKRECHQWIPSKDIWHPPQTLRGVDHGNRPLFFDHEVQRLPESKFID